VQVVARGILEDDRARRDLEVTLDQFEEAALGRAVGSPVDEALLDVLEAADGIEVVLLVVVERPLSRSRLQIG
jgi:hypothetical protein